MGGNVARKGAVRNAYKISVGQPEGKRLLGDLGVDGTAIFES
jgi:hypothetical protein